VLIEIGAHSFANSREEAGVAEPRQESERFQLVLDRVLQFGKAERDARRVQ